MSERFRIVYRFPASIPLSAFGAFVFITSGAFVFITFGAFVSIAFGAFVYIPFGTFVFITFGDFVFTTFGAFVFITYGAFVFITFGALVIFVSLVGDGVPVGRLVGDTLGDGDGAALSSRRLRRSM